MSNATKVRHRYSDEEIGFVESNWERPAEWVASELGRSTKSVYGMRSKIASGWQPVAPEGWTEDEDAIIRGTLNLTARQVSDRLPGRTEAGVWRRRQMLSLNASPAKDKMPWMGSRPLLAKTCTACGLLLDGSWFRLSTSGGRKQWVSRCRKCANRISNSIRDKKHTPRSAKLDDASRTIRQRVTRDRADRHGQPWTGNDDQILRRDDLTLVEKALLLGRTWAAVQHQCSKSGYSSKVGLGTPEGIWIIGSR